VKTSHPFFQDQNYTTKMATNSQEDPKPDGAAFDDFFDSIGKKAEHLTIDERNGKKDPATNGTAPLDTAAKDAEEDENEPKIVDEIESLCMNCHENVWFLQISQLLTVVNN
jgi:zinc finger protein